MSKQMIGTFRCLAMLAIFTLPVLAQDYPIASEPVHMRERAVTFSLTTTGLGLGGSYRFNLPNYTHWGLNLEFFVVSDDKEIEVYDPLFNRFFKLNDANRMFLITGDIELKKRLFANTIEDNFRPHLMLQTGVAYGMNFPREEIFLISGITERVLKPENEYALTYNVVVGFGVDVTTRKNFFAGIRPQYRITFFQDEIAGKKNHSAFEIKFEIGGQF